jgi:hypothetical protein
VVLRLCVGAPGVVVVAVGGLPLIGGEVGTTAAASEGTVSVSVSGRFRGLPRRGASPCVLSGTWLVCWDLVSSCTAVAVTGRLGRRAAAVVPTAIAGSSSAVISIGLRSEVGTAEPSNQSTDCPVNPSIVSLILTSLDITTRLVFSV